MKDLPDSIHALVVRTDYSDEAAWASICSEIENPVDEYPANVSFVSDPEYEGLSISDLTALQPIQKVGAHGAACDRR